VGPKTFAHWIEAIPAGSEISLYLHVPFCRRLCWFCACRTQGTSSDAPVLAYAKVLKTEIALLKRHLPRGVRLSRLHWGGGTPTLLAPDSMRALADAVFDAVPMAEGAEFSVEIDPNEIDAEAMRRAITGLNALRMNDPERLGDWFGRFMTLYRSVGDALNPDPPRSRIEIEFDLQQGAVLARHPWTRAAWRRSSEHKRIGKLYIAGQTHALPLADASALAAAQTLDAEAYAALSPDGQALVLELLAEGHYRLDADDVHDDGDDDA
jgi:hypothetical protein